MCFAPEVGLLDMSLPQHHLQTSRMSVNMKQFLEGMSLTTGPAHLSKSASLFMQPSLIMQYFAATRTVAELRRVRFNLYRELHESPFVVRPEGVAILQNWHSNIRYTNQPACIKPRSLPKSGIVEMLIGQRRKAYPVTGRCSQQESDAPFLCVVRNHADQLALLTSILSMIFRAFEVQANGYKRRHEESQNASQIFKHQRPSMMKFTKFIVSVLLIR